MYALPQQTREAALADLEAAIALGPAHLSHYQLTLEPGTAFFHRPPPLPDDDLAWQMQLDCQARLAAAGFAQYEISAYAQPGRQCRHNLNYWRFGDYLGIGAGAHGKVTVDGKVVRTEKPRSPRAYLEARRPGRLTAHEVGAGRAAVRVHAECAAADGRLHRSRTSNARPACLRRLVRPTLADLAARGLLEARQGGFRPSDLGFRFLNDLMAAFLPDRQHPPRSPRVVHSALPASCRRGTLVTLLVRCVKCHAVTH